MRTQTLYARNLFLSIRDDSFLYGFRTRAGKPAPGKPLAGWYGDDLFNAFGQYISGMTRLSKALGDSEIGNKAKRLALEWAKTFGSNGFFYYSPAPKPPHYIYDKFMCGLVDLYEYGDFKKETLPLMNKITDWAVANLDRTRQVAANHKAAPNGTRYLRISTELTRLPAIPGSRVSETSGNTMRIGTCSRASPRRAA